MHVASPPRIVAAFYSPNGKDHHVIVYTKDNAIYTYLYSRSGHNKPLEKLFPSSSYASIVDIVAYDFVNDNRCHALIATHDHLICVSYPHLK
ncbi:hypothetical protein Krac_3398 [Ktedonobacter racemifer DSM 44963]|uniref:Uncharacterized protein n=1 Tax=Ktedonobacter racemifer DSM 44963 TaxID=485913 RepID=D6U184_KTERA|nr:hypothetical protein Krac_3398 [Ktedonobacter racemifer DSM 44963]